MTKQYYAVLTHYGEQKLATAIATRQPLNITHFAVGDGNGRETTPNPSYTALVQEVYRANISVVSRDPRNSQQIIFELTIPENVGGFYIREMGIFDAQNKLVGYANSPESFKPTEQSGSGKLQVIRMILRVSSSEAVQLTVDNSVIFASRHQLNPKTINASSQNNVDETGHSHQIAQASTAQAGITQLDNAINSNAEDRAATPKAVKQVNDKVERNTRDLNERIPNSKKSSATNSDSEDNVATSRAVKTAYDLANSKQSPATTLAGYGITDFQVRTATGNLNDFRTAGIYSINSIHNSYNRPAEGVRQSQGFTGNLQVITGGAGNESWCHQIFYRHYSDEVYERYQTASNSSSWSAWKKRGSDGIPVGSVVAFPKEIANPQGFLRCDGTTFAQNTYPDLYRVLGNKNRLPNLTRSDVGMMAWFPQDNIPSGWLACNGGTISNTDYPELHRYLNNKYGTNKLPNAEDRFIRNAGNGLRVGEKQEDAIRNIRGELKSIFGSDRYAIYTTGSGVFEVTGRQADYSFGTGGHHEKKDTTIFDASKVVPTANENRPKSIIFKLCIKAKNSLDDVQFWIKAFGEVTNAGTLDAGRLAQNLQDKADRAHTHTVSQITDFAQGVAGIFAQNMGENGWTVLPNGLMIQWGVATTNNILFPRAFPQECFIVSHSKTGGGRDTRISNVSRTGFASFATVTVGTTYYVAIGH